MSTEEKSGPRAALRVPVPPPKGKPTADTAADWLAKYCKAPPESVWIPGFRPAALSRTAGASSVKAVGKEPARMGKGYPAPQAIMLEALPPPRLVSPLEGASDSK